MAAPRGAGPSREQAAQRERRRRQQQPTQTEQQEQQSPQTQQTQEQQEQEQQQATRRSRLRAVADDVWLSAGAACEDGDPRPGDVVLLRTAGAAYATTRQLLGQEHDHAVVVLARRRVLHVSPPVVRTLPLASVMLRSRRPLVLRPSLSESERARFLDGLEGLVGRRYSLAQLARAVAGLGLRRAAQVAPWAAVPAEWLLQVDIKADPAARSRGNICTDAILGTLCAASASLERAVAATAPALDFGPGRSGSLADVVRLHAAYPSLLPRVELVEVPADARARRPARELALALGVPDVVYVVVDDERGLDAGGVGAPRAWARMSSSSESRAGAREREREREWERRSQSWGARGRPSPSLRRFGAMGELADAVQAAFDLAVSRGDQALLSRLARALRRAVERALPPLDLDEQHRQVLGVVLFAGTLLFAVRKGRLLARLLYRALQLLALRRIMSEVWDRIAVPARPVPARPGPARPVPARR